MNRPIPQVADFRPIIYDAPFELPRSLQIFFFIYMRALSLICSIITNAIASINSPNPFALITFIREFGVYSRDEMPTKLPARCGALADLLFDWAILSESEFIERAKEVIRGAHKTILTLNTGILLQMQINAMAASVENEDERLVEFAKIYRDAMRKLKEFNPE